MYVCIYGIYVYICTYMYILELKLRVFTSMQHFSIIIFYQITYTFTAIVFSPYTVFPGTKFFVSNVSSLPRAIKTPRRRK